MKVPLMSDKAFPVAVDPEGLSPRPRPANIPSPFAPLFERREKRVLGDAFGISNFGVNLVRLAPGGVSSLRHAHAHQEEFVYILTGEPTLVTDAGETALRPGMCAGFRAVTVYAPQLVNRTGGEVVYLEIGDRTPGDSVAYPDDDMEAAAGPDGRWVYRRKDGTPY
jgi:uncharacterized cupin superfamily protein